MSADGTASFAPGKNLTGRRRILPHRKWSWSGSRREEGRGKSRRRPARDGTGTTGCGGRFVSDPQRRPGAPKGGIISKGFAIADRRRMRATETVAAGRRQRAQSQDGGPGNDHPQPTRFAGLRKTHVDLSIAPPWNAVTPQIYRLRPPPAPIPVEPPVEGRLNPAAIPRAEPT